MNFRIAGFLLIITLIGGGFIFHFTRPKGPAEVALQESRPPEAEFQLHTIHYTETDQGRKVWELVADSAQVFREGPSTVLENARVIFYGAEGQVYTLSANQGTLENATKNIMIRGDVLATTSDGDTIRTDSLHYRASEKVIETKDRVRMTRAGLQVTGEGMVCHLQDGTVALLGDVKASIDSPVTQ